MDYRPFIQQALEKASNLAIEHFGNVSGSVKPEDNNQVLTEADIAIGNTLVGVVREQFPDHNVIDEEAGVIDNGSNFTWVIDPIDGTSNFANGLPMYGCMIGLLEGDTPIAGGIVLPYFKEFYVAQKGFGATCNGVNIHVSEEKTLLNSLVSYGIDGYQQEPSRTRKEVEVLSEVVLGIRNLRSTNSIFDLMMTAKGAFGASLNQTSKIWDNIAPHIIIEEAGGMFTDFWGKPMDYSNCMQRTQDNFTVCTGAPQIHEALQHIIHAQ